MPWLRLLFHHLIVLLHPIGLHVLLVTFHHRVARLHRVVRLHGVAGLHRIAGLHLVVPLHLVVHLHLVVFLHVTLRRRLADDTAEPDCCTDHHHDDPATQPPRPLQHVSSPPSKLSIDLLSQYGGRRRSIRHNRVKSSGNIARTASTDRTASSRG